MGYTSPKGNDFKVPMIVTLTIYPDNGESMKVAQESDKAAWNRFVEANGGPPYTSWEWGELCEYYGHDPVRLCAKFEGKFYGCLPVVHLQSRLFGDVLISMPYSEHGSTVISSESRRDEARRLLLNRARELADERGVKYLCLRGARHPGTENYLRFNQALTFEVDVGQDTDHLWTSTETRFRTAVRNAEDQDVLVERVTFAGDVADFYDLYAETLRRHGIPPHSRGFFRRMWDLLKDHDRLEIFFARSPGDSTPIATALLLSFGDRVHYKHAASNAVGRQSNAGPLVLWEALKWASEGGYSTFDLGRTRKGTGVYEFKRSINGRELYLDDLYYYPGDFVPPPNPDQVAFRPLIRLWKQLPLKVTTLIGPHVRKGLP